MTLTRAAKLVVRCEQCDERCDAAVEREQGNCDVRVNLQRKLHAVDNEKHADQLKVLQDRLNRAQAWYRSPVFVASITTVLVVAGLLTARELIVETNP